MVYRERMAHGKKTGGKNFAKGQSGNPGGRPKLEGDLREMMKERRLAIVTEIHRQLELPFETIHKMTEDKSLPAQVFLIARILTQAANKGCHFKATFIFENALAPVPKAISFVDDEGKTYRPLATVSTTELLGFFEALQKKKESK